MFSIKFLDNSFNEEPFGEKACCGVITINAFQEQFVSPTTYWSQEDYERQWITAISQILGGANSSCLITSMYDPKLAEFILWWPLYREGNIIFIQNHILFMNEISGEFDPWNLQPFIPPHETYTEEGECISEWEVTIEDLESFIKPIL